MKYRDLRDFLGQLEAEGELVRVAEPVSLRLEMTALADRVFPIFGEVFGEIRPAATMIVCDLIRPEMLIEIEVTALKRS